MDKNKLIEIFGDEVQWIDNEEGQIRGYFGDEHSYALVERDDETFSFSMMIDEFRLELFSESSFEELIKIIVKFVDNVNLMETFDLTPNGFKVKEEKE